MIYKTQARRQDSMTVQIKIATSERLSAASDNNSYNSNSDNDSSDDDDVEDVAGTMVAETAQAPDVLQQFAKKRGFLNSSRVRLVH